MSTMSELSRPLVNIEDLVVLVIGVQPAIGKILIISTIAAPQEVREQCQSLRAKEAKNH